MFSYHANTLYIYVAELPIPFVDKNYANIQVLAVF